MKECKKNDNTITSKGQILTRENSVSAMVLTGAAVPDGMGKQIWLDGLQCRGTEWGLVDCPHNSFGTITSCTHAEDVGVTCQQFVPGKCHGIVLYS